MTQYSYSTFTGDGSTAAYTLSFDYMKRAHVSVHVDGTVKVDGTDYDWTADKQITFKGGKIPASGEKILISRDTPESDQIVLWQNGSYVVAEDLNESDLQWLYNIQELYDGISKVDGGTSGPAVKKITGTAPVEVDSTNAQEPNISVDETVSTDNPNALTSDTRLMSEKAIDGAFSQAVGASGVYPPAGVTGKVGKLRIDDTGAEPKQFYWNGTAWVQIPTKGDKGDQGIPGPPPGLQDPAATANNVPLKANNVLGDATAAVTADGDGDLRFDFGIPVGQKGDKGDQGIEGIEGPVGPPPGLQSPAATATNVPLQPGNVLGQAYASVSADGSGDLKFNFGIPVGQKGDKGDVGDGVNYLGEIDATTAPAPSNPVNGDFYVNTTEGTSSWPGLGAVHVNSRLIYNSNTGQWDQYDPLDNVWREVGGEVYPVNAAADVKIGGVLPGAPSITLNASGSGIFNSTLTTKAQVIAVSDDAYMLTSSRSGNNLPSYFAAEGNDINGNATSVRLGVKGGVAGGYLFLNAIPGNSDQAILTRTGDFLIGGTLPSAPNISLNASGNAEFASYILSGPNTGVASSDATGVTVHGKTGAGQVLIYKSSSDTTAQTRPFFGCYTPGASPKTLVEFASDGSAEFAGVVQVDGSFDNEYALRLKNRSSTKPSGILIDLPNTSADVNPAIRVKVNGGVDTTLINTDGSATFNSTGQFGGSWSNDDSPQVRAFIGSNVGSVRVKGSALGGASSNAFGVYAGGSDSASQTYGVYYDGHVEIGGTIPSAPNISLNADGSGEFSSFVMATVDQDYGIVSARKDGTTGSKTAIYLAPANNVVAAGISSTAENDFLSTSNRVASLGFISRNGEPEPTEKARLTPTGNFEVGGLLGTAPNISLNASGNAYFGGGIVATNNTTGLNWYQDLGMLRIQQESSKTDSCFSVYKGGTNKQTIGFKSDGSAYFDDTLTCGSTTTSGTGVSARCNANNSAANSAVSATNYNSAGLVWRGRDGNDINTTTSKIFANGSATFAGNVQSGGSPFGATADGIAFNAAGLVEASRSNGANIIFRGYVTGDSNPNVEILANGSANFADAVKIGETGTGNTGAIIDNVGAYTSRVAGGTSKAFTVKTSANNDEQIVFYGNGSATFANGNFQINDNGRTVIGASDEIIFSQNGSATFAGTIYSGGNPFNGTATGSAITETGNLLASAASNSAVITTFTTGSNSPTFRVDGSGNAHFVGDVSSDGTIGFNLEPENPDNWTVTEEEYEVEVPKLRPDGPVTADLVNGAPEQEMQTITRTREVKTYTGPTMDVKDTLLKITEALTQLKAAAASAETCEELRTAIDTALADV